MAWTGPLTLPPEPYFPGQNTRPSETYFAPFKAGVSGGVGELEECAAFSAGLSAFGERYYWEAHEFWEPVWMALPQNSVEKLFLRGLIQLANAGLKARMGKDGAALRILKLADAALAEALVRAGDAPILGMSRGAVQGLRRQAIEDSASIVHYDA
ncbi:DUF309 domain-containing protein [Pseudoprimorskyibacter insulae]|uniref:DUF309 domain-containing protein n=1 Tax=Pseudoprimorskyibacter insulae TaxID=1695997 RepID=A0A2R8AZZ2_9RHOB|nr:DUF309 domain-containing protein [Pseudoprimorskyibacter insulae]SPF81612.1 hypothetical protein PRI8871_03437 [Pseudoprimorskyibacter insulae]